ncbi:MAG: DnaJ domain-containing protein [Pseudacidovorax sp.]|uniref:DnaJ C-terminal domain-containing protein n=1 Tax=Pseudacidovorax sp. TaxID=1934311 RepID=UPI001B68D378|nr:DnaJ C-terminal domain-containing protein [Pseudacidovorax sp.]MBP6893181.1 DnaJ domain-containing protein [Pseudacidovorax sp.]
MDASKNHYDTLGVAPDATADEIRKAYRRLARKYHPDVSKEADAQTRMREINEAHEVLGDPARRAEYDAMAERLRRGATMGHGDGFAPPPGWEDGSSFFRSGGPGAGAEAPDLGAFFSDLFGAGATGPTGGGAARRTRAATGEDRHAAIEVPLEFALAGGEREIQLQAVELDAGGRPRPVTRTLQVRVPRGVRPGQQIRLAGQGMPGIGGEPAGDLYLEVRIAPHPLYRVEGRDLVMDLPVTPAEAALGAEVEVPLPGGGTGQVKVPAAARAGMKLRLKGRGLGGDLYLVLSIAVAPADSAAARAAYEQLARATAGFDPRRDLGARSRTTSTA